MNQTNTVASADQNHVNHDAGPVLYSEHDGIVILQLNRPESRNALNTITLQTLAQHLDTLAPRRDVRAVILAGGAQGVFCAGADLKEREAMTLAQTRTFLHLIRTTVDKIEALPMPTIAAMDGSAFGGGCELALACDMRILADTAQIGLTECALGIIPGAGGTQRLPRLVGVAKAKELILTAKRVVAADAEKIGLINRIAASGSVVAAAQQLAAEIGQCAPLAVEAAKAAIDGGLSCGIREGLLLEARAYEVTLYTEDRREALRAFKEKRKPNFKGQ